MRKWVGNFGANTVLQIVSTVTITQMTQPLTQSCLQF